MDTSPSAMAEVAYVITYMTMWVTLAGIVIIGIAPPTRRNR